MKKFIVGLLISLPAWAGFVVPATPHPVNDYAGVLTISGKEAIAKKIVELKQELGVQVGVLIIPTLDGTDIVTAAEQVMGSWKLGSKEKDDGILLMLSISDRKSRIEVGRGLEGVLTDAQSKEILYSMRSFLRSGDYDGAVDHGLSYIYNTIQTGKADIMVKPKAASSDGFGTDVLFICFGIFAMFGIGMVIYNYRQRKYDEEMKARLAEARRREDALADKAYQNLLASVKTRSDAKKVKTSGITGIAPAYSAPKKKSSESHNTYIPVPIVVEESSSRSYSSSDDSSSSSSSYSDSSYSGGGGDFSGGGSSDSW